MNSNSSFPPSSYLNSQTSTGPLYEGVSTDPYDQGENGESEQGVQLVNGGQSQAQNPSLIRSRRNQLDNDQQPPMSQSRRAFFAALREQLGVPLSPDQGNTD